MSKPKLAIVIHAEEEFDWDKGFYRSNTSVNHGDELIAVVEEIIRRGGKVTLAMDYPFVSSTDGRKVIEHFLPFESEAIEFATHLHPWVNPPFTHDIDREKNHLSFPGNLPRELEFDKLKMLTERVQEETGTRPVTYLAGRYGIGINTVGILKELGYKIDLSISAYSNFSHVEGPNFVTYTNKVHTKDGLIYIPHTCSMGAITQAFGNHLNLNPSTIERIQQSKMSSLLYRLLRISKLRLSPEGFSYLQMRTMTERQIAIGQEEFVLSFHSPSVSVGGTTYVRSEKVLAEFKEALYQYIDWFNSIEGSSTFLPAKVAEEKIASNATCCDKTAKALS